MKARPQDVAAAEGEMHIIVLRLAARHEPGHMTRSPEREIRIEVRQLEFGGNFALNRTDPVVRRGRDRSARGGDHAFIGTEHEHGDARQHSSGFFQVFFKLRAVQRRVELSKAVQRGGLVRAELLDHQIGPVGLEAAGAIFVWNRAFPGHVNAHAYDGTVRNATFRFEGDAVDERSVRAFEVHLHGACRRQRDFHGVAVSHLKTHRFFARDPFVCTRGRLRERADFHCVRFQFPGCAGFARVA